MKSTRLIIGLFFLLWVVSIGLACSHKHNRISNQDNPIAITNTNPAVALYDTAFQYANGINVKPNPAKEKEFLLKAAEYNYGPAEMALGDFLLFGRDGLIDSTAAIYWFERASKHNILEADYALGCIYSKRNQFHNDSLSLVWFQKAANYGHPKAQYIIGSFYKEGHLLTRDPNLYVLWTKKSAHHNYAPAQYELGCCYEQGICFERDTVQAIQWFSKSSLQGFYLAHPHLIILTQTCEPKTKETAVLSFPTKKLFMTEAYMLYRRGFDLLFGITEPQDQSEAIPYLIAATLQGNKKAKIMLSYCFATAFGVILSKEAATHLYVGKGEIRYDDADGSYLIEFEIKDDGTFEKTLNFSTEKNKFKSKT